MLYLVFVNVDTDRNHEWFRWMRDKHVADVLATGCFADAVMVRDRDADTATQTSYQIHYRAHSEQAFERYQRDFGPALRDEHTALFGDAAVARRQLLPVVLRLDGQ